MAWRDRWFNQPACSREFNKSCLFQPLDVGEAWCGLPWTGRSESPLELSEGIATSYTAMGLWAKQFTLDMAAWEVRNMPGQNQSHVVRLWKGEAKRRRNSNPPQQRCVQAREFYQKKVS